MLGLGEPNPPKPPYPPPPPTIARQSRAVLGLTERGALLHLREHHGRSLGRLVGGWVGELGGGLAGWMVGGLVGWSIGELGGLMDG